VSEQDLHMSRPQRYALGINTVNGFFFVLFLFCFVHCLPFFPSFILVDAIYFVLLCDFAGKAVFPDYLTRSLNALLDVCYSV
jgi:hypothetical protein